MLFRSNLSDMYNTFPEYKSSVGRVESVATRTEPEVNPFNTEFSVNVPVILLTYKDLQPLPLGLQPIKNWKTFTN